MVLQEGLDGMATGWQVWINWMTLINTASIVFAVKHVPARIVLGVWILNVATMMIAAELVGFTRILGLVHIVWWTPLVIYLVTRIRENKIEGTWHLRWVYVLLATICASLVIDAVDVIRFALGDRS